MPGQAKLRDHRQHRLQLRQQSPHADHNRWIPLKGPIFRVLCLRDLKPNLIGNFRAVLRWHIRSPKQRVAIGRDRRPRAHHHHYPRHATKRVVGLPGGNYGWLIFNPDTWGSGPACSTERRQPRCYDAKMEPTLEVGFTL